MELDYQLMFGIDKQLHFLIYAVNSIVLGVLIILILNGRSVKQTIIFTWFVLVAIGIVEEYRQYMLPNRSAEFLDAIANMLGVTFGLAIPLLISYMIRLRKENNLKRFIIYSFILIPLFFWFTFY